MLDLFVIEKPDLPDIEIAGETTLTEKETSFYSLPEFQDLLYDWYIENGTIASYPQQNSVEVKWGSRGTGMISCILKHELGCELYTVSLEVLLNPNAYNEIAMRKLSLFPNPAQNIIKINSIDSGHRYLIINLQGEFILETFQNEIDIESLSPGSYIMLVKDRAGSIVNRQLFVKTR